MKRVLLFFPSPSFGKVLTARAYLPLNLLCIGSPLDRAGYVVRIIDQRIDNQWETTLAQELSNEPLCVGITCMTGPQITHGLAAARLVRQYGKGVPIVWGGIHPTLMPEQTLENDHVDIVVQGEGEETFPELVRALESNRPLGEVRGIWYKNNGGMASTPPRSLIDLNNQPPLSYHLVQPDKYLFQLHGQRFLSLESSRGCPHRCAYCYNPSVYNRKWRALTADETVRRIKILSKDYGATGIWLCDDNFFSNKQRALAIFTALKEQQLGISVDRVDVHPSVASRLTDAELGLIRDGGGHSMSLGVESGSPRILGLIKKDSRSQTSAVLEFNRRVAKLGIVACYNLMMGFPTESLEELAQTISLFLRLMNENENALCLLNTYTPFPGTELFDVCQENGLKAPGSLEEWARFNYRKMNEIAPWLTAERRELLRVLDFAALAARRYNIIMLDREKLTPAALLGRLYRPLAMKRMEKLYSRFPIEIRLARLLGLFPEQG